MEEKTLHKHLVAQTDGKAEPDNILIAGSIRITVIFPNLIRVECGSENPFAMKRRKVFGSAITVRSILHMK